MLSLAIVGLPNVGKSTLFNALTKSKQADAANYPFCTIEPNVGVVEVPDSRLQPLAETSKALKIVPTAIEFVDVAGLVKGASEGEGLGNKFLSHIRECDAIIQVVRVFEDGNIIHVHGGVNPKRDIEIIESELLFADMQTMENRISKAKSSAKSGKKEDKDYADLLDRVYEQMGNGILVSNIKLTPEEKELLRDLHL